MMLPDDIVAYFTAPAADTALAFPLFDLSRGDVVERVGDPGNRLTVVRAGLSDDGRELVEYRCYCEQCGEGGRVRSVPRSSVRPVLNG
jgi:hypothetical protein